MLPQAVYLPKIVLQRLIIIFSRKLKVLILQSKGCCFLRFSWRHLFPEQIGRQFLPIHLSCPGFFRSPQFMWWFLHWVAHISCPFFLILYFKAFATCSKGISLTISVGFHKGLIQTQFWISSWIFCINIFLILYNLPL